MKNAKRIPNFSIYSVTTDGVVYNHITGNTLSGSINGSGYLCFRIKDDNNIYRTMGGHRLVALTYIPVEGDVDELVVNHLDGDKLNNVVGNLEWCTYQDNFHHAGMYLNSPKCKPIQARDVLTGEITTFNSYIDCANKFGFSKDQIALRLKRDDQGWIYPEGKQYRLYSKDTWTSPLLNENSYGTFITKPVLVKDVLTGEVTLYPQSSDVCRKYNYTSSMFCKRLRDKRQPVLPGFIQVKKYSDPTPWRDINDPLDELGKTLHSKFIVVERDDKKILYPTAKEVSVALGIPKSTVLYRVNVASSSYVDSNGIKMYYYDSRSVSWETMILCTS